MKQTPGFGKIGHIISLSNNYLNHLTNLNRVKGLVDNSTTKRNSDISQYLSRQQSYKIARKKISNKLLTRQNEKFVQRLTNITDRRKNESRVSSRSNQNIERTLSEQVLDYKTRRNFLKSRQVKNQNSKIGERIKNAHFKNGLSPKNYQSARRENNSYKKMHSRFSSQSKGQLKQILDGLNIDHRKIPFLPTLPSRRYSKN